MTGDPAGFDRRERTKRPAPGRQVVETVDQVADPLCAGCWRGSASLSRMWLKIRAKLSSVKARAGLVGRDAHCLARRSDDRALASRMGLAEFAPERRYPVVDACIVWVGFAVVVAPGRERSSS
jgi:hypothetical protein